jgi:hypothetical protein
MTEREATLDELLSEPIVRKVMASDGVHAADVRRLVQQASLRTSRKRSRQSSSIAMQLAFDFALALCRP